MTEPVGSIGSNLTREDARQLRYRVLQYVRECGQRGSTCDEAEVALGLTHQTCSARFTELSRHPVHGGKIRISAWRRHMDDQVVRIKRATRSGRMAYVYIAVEDEHE
jgi:hypothetical protein